jgi:hypothetical protein
MITVSLSVFVVAVAATLSVRYDIRPGRAVTFAVRG